MTEKRIWLFKAGLAELIKTFMKGRNLDIPSFLLCIFYAIVKIINEKH